MNRMWVTLVSIFSINSEYFRTLKHIDRDEYLNMHITN